MKLVPAKVGTQPYGCVDIRYKRSVEAGDVILWRERKSHPIKWRRGLVTRIIGDPKKPSHVFIDEKDLF